MTSPREESDLLMFCASFSRCPCADVFLSRSLPARSMRLSSPWGTPLRRMRTWRTRCERLEWTFTLLLAVLRCSEPMDMMSSTSATSLTSTSIRPSTNTLLPETRRLPPPPPPPPLPLPPPPPPPLCTRTSRSSAPGVSGGARRSRIRSLYTSSIDTLKDTSLSVGISAARSNKCFRARQLTPRLSAGPSMVYVLPEPVWP
eukprot:scaffold442_cov268-Pinguiococcus_pyrenoidosus.AAC.100